MPLVLSDPNGLDWGVTSWTDSDGVRHTNYHWFDGPVGTYKNRAYTPVDFGSQGYRDVTTTNGQIVRISNIGIVRRVIYSGPSGGGPSPAALNMTAGLVDGAIPFGRQIREAAFGSMGIDTDSPEYQNAETISMGVSFGAQLLTGAGAAQGGIRIASRLGNESAEMTVVRIIERGENLSQIIDEAKHMALVFDKEYALVKLASGERALVSGGKFMINFPENSITRLIGHVHPPGAAIGGASKADRAALTALGQKSGSWVFDGGVKYKFYKLD